MNIEDRIADSLRLQLDALDVPPGDLRVTRALGLGIRRRQRALACAAGGLAAAVASLWLLRHRPDTRRLFG